MRVDNGCSIYITFGGKKMKIPVNPEKIEIEHPSDNKKYNVLGKGEIVVPRRPSLRVASWESFFPSSRQHPYVNSGAKKPKDYVAALEKAMRTKQKCRLIITRSHLPDTNMRCIVSEFKLTDKGAEPDDIYYSIKLMEYKAYEPEIVQIIVEPTPEQPTADVATEQQRAVETPVLRVGATVVANGKYWYDSGGSKPFGTANNLSTTVTRIASGRPYPIHIGQHGWLQESQIQITG